MSGEFREFGKIARLQRDVVVTEKIDGTNAQVMVEPMDEDVRRVSEAAGLPLPADIIAVVEGLAVYAGSRNRWLQPGKTDNFGFAQWVLDHVVDLARGLGVGRHFGEWWGAGIQRRYGLDHKRFSLFNTSRWGVDREEKHLQHPEPECCHVVPVIYSGLFCGGAFGREASGPTPWHYALDRLRERGSFAAPGFMNPEGIVLFHAASGQLFKQTLVGDEKPKGR